MTNDNFNMFGGGGPFAMGGIGGRILTPACVVNTQARTPHNHNACIMQWKTADIINPSDKILNETLNATMKIEGDSIKPKVAIDEVAPKLKEGFMEIFSEIQNALKPQADEAVKTNTPNFNETKTDSNSGRVKVNVNAQSGESTVENTVKSDDMVEEFDAKSMHMLAENSKPKVSKEVMDIIKNAASNGENTVSIINTIATSNDVKALNELGFGTEEVSSGGYPDIVRIKVYW